MFLNLITFLNIFILHLLLMPMQLIEIDSYGSLF
jgi:hypothetical protein